MVMTVLMHDASNNPAYKPNPAKTFEELLYADDTLILGADECNVALYMQAVNDAGAEYGLAFNWSRLEVLNLERAMRKQVLHAYWGADSRKRSLSTWAAS